MKNFLECIKEGAMLLSQIILWLVAIFGGFAIWLWLLLHYAIPTSIITFVVCSYFIGRSIQKEKKRWMQ